MRRAAITTIIAAASVGLCHADMNTVADSIPENWTYTSSQFQSLPPDDKWWAEFDDPMLDRLISMAVDRNANVAVALRRVEIARLAIKNARSGYYPTIGASAGWTKSRQSGNMTSMSTEPVTTDYFSAGLDMAWEVDLFGRVGSQVKEAKAQYQASKADYLAAMNTLCAEVANEYITLRTLQSQLEVADTHLASQEKVLKIAEARHEAGLNSKLDVAQASTIYHSTAATIPTLRAQITSAVNALAVLLGDYPENVAPLLSSPAQVPDYRRIVAIGLPRDLLRRRPDVRAAEYDMASSAAAVGVAKKDFLPVVSIEGSVGVASHRPGDMFNHRSLTYSVAPKISWTIFDGLARNSALASARENMKIAVDRYNLAVLTAVGEAETALASYTGQIASIAALEKVVEDAKEQVILSVDLYKQGLVDFLSVANAQISYLQYSDQLAEARGKAAISLVTLYKSLGGGWTADQAWQPSN